VVTSIATTWVVASLPMATIASSPMATVAFLQLQFGLAVPYLFNFDLFHKFTTI